MAADGRRYSGEHAEALERARRLAQLFDSAFRIPGTDWRVGLDAILGLVPGVGDVATMVPALWILEVARRVGVPRRTRLRMLANLGMDAAIGTIPLVGDLADARIRANLRNVELIERYLERRAADERPPL